MIKKRGPGGAGGDILIADDDLGDLQLLSGMLALKGYEVRDTWDWAITLSMIEKVLAMTRWRVSGDPGAEAHYPGGPHEEVGD